MGDSANVLATTAAAFGTIVAAPIHPLYKLLHGNDAMYTMYTLRVLENIASIVDASIASQIGFGLRNLENQRSLNVRLNISMFEFNDLMEQPPDYRQGMK